MRTLVVTQNITADGSIEMLVIGSIRRGKPTRQASSRRCVGRTVTATLS